MNMFNSLGFDSQLQMFLLDGVNGAAGFAVNWLLQSTLLIAVGLVVGALLRSRGSAVQSLVYRTTLVAVLICPLATVALASAGFSGWSVNMPDAWAMEVSEPDLDSKLVSEVESEVVQLDLIPEFAVESRSAAGDISTATVLPESRQDFPSTVSPSSPAQVEEPAIEPMDIPEAESPALTAESIFTVKTFGVIASFAALLWCLVAIALCLRLASAWSKLWRLKRSATKVEPELNLVCEQLSVRMKVSAPEIFRSPFLPSPCLAGLHNPSILLPEDDCRLSMQDVLIHELAHLRRHDCHWNLLRQIATSLFFFQPLLWILSRKLEIAAEEVCDDFVVQFGGNRTEYANRLVGIAELSTAPIAAAGVGVVSLRSMLSHRVTRILDTSRTLSTRASNLLFVTVLCCGLLGTAMTGLLGLNSAAPEAVVVSLNFDDENEPQGPGDAIDAKRGDDSTAEVMFQKETPSDPSDASKARSQIIKYRGKVVDEDDRPIANATVEMNRWQKGPFLPPHSPLATTTSGREGEFELIIDKSKFPNAGPRFWKETGLSAHGKGYGIDWVDGQNIKPNQPINLSIVADEVPVTGRLVSLEGEPLPDVSVRLSMLWASDDEDLDPVLKALREGQIFWEATNEHLPNMIRQFPQAFQKNIKTDAEGYFSISGLGQERVMLVSLEGPTIAFTPATIATRKMEPIVANNGMPDPDWSQQQTIHGANCVITVPPSQPVTGIVKDAKTGEPMAGVGIESYRLTKRGMSAQRQIRVKTDKDGRYTMRGLPKGAGNQIIAVPNDDQPYLMRVFDVPNPTGMKPIDLDLELNRGVWITGKLTSKATGKNIRVEDEAYVYYYPYLSNPFAQATPEYDRQNFYGYQQRYKIAADGSYRLVGLPGKAIVGATVGYAPFPQGQGAEEIDGADEDGKFPTYRVGVGPGPKHPTIFSEVDIAETTESFELNFQLDSGKNISIAMTDPAGKNLEGVKVQGHERFSWWKEMPAATFEAAAFKLGEKRTILFHHPERRLGKVVRVTAGEEADQKLSVQLQPCVAVGGRLVDKDKEPISGARIRIDVSPSEDFAPNLKNVSTDADGRFEHAEVLTGSEYTVMAEAASMGFTVLARNLKVSAGEKIDLGTIDVSSKERPEPKRMKGPKTSNANSSKLPTYSGRVETSQGKPIAGAKIWLASSHGFNSEVNRENFKGLLRELGTSDEQGRFAVSLDAKTTRQIGFSPTQLISPAQLVATTEGRGMDWMPLEVFQDNVASSKQRDMLQSRVDKARGNGRFANRALTLRPESKPIRGRLVDLEGRPLPKVKVLVESLYQPDVAGLLNALGKSSKGELNDVLTNSRFGVGGLARSELQKLIPPVTTKENGEFELSGIGDDQLATLIFDADRIEARPMNVLGREMETVSLPHMKNFPDGSKDVFAGRDFSYAVGPSIPVEGVVTDYDTGKPVANVLVHVERLFKDSVGKNSQLRLDTHHLRTVTDEKGRFRITGMPPGEGHVIEAVPPKSAPYLMTSQEVSPRLADGDAKRIEIKVKRGVWIEGRVTDKRSGEPLAASVDYLALKKNPHSFESLGLGWVWCKERYRTDRDGNYRMLGLPGPGVLLVKSQVSGYPLASGAETIDGCNDSRDFIPTTPFPLQGIFMREYHLLKQIDPAANATTFSSDMTLDAGLSISGRVVGPDGKPIFDLRVLGQTDQDQYFRPKPADNVSPSDKFTVNGYDGKGPRQLFFKNGAETLVGQYRVEGDVDKEIVVTLQPSVTVTGRLIQKENDLPAARYFVACEECSLGSEKSQPMNFTIHWCHTDDDGRFEIKGLMAGAKYKMNAFKQSNDIRFTIDLTDAKPGDVIEIDDGPLLFNNDATSTQTSLVNAQAVEDVAAESNDAPATTIRTVILLPDGNPATETHVALTGFDYEASREVVFDNGITNKNGEFALTCKDLGSEQDRKLLIARKDGLAVGWKVLNRSKMSSDEPIKISLHKQGTVKGRLVDIDGQPAAGEKLQVETIINPKADRGSVDAMTAFRMSRDGPPKAWIQPVTTDKEGRFELTGAPESFGVHMILFDSKKFAPQRISLNTGQPEQRGPRDRTYRPLVKNVEPGKEAVLTLSPAKIITGKVTYEDTGEPVPNTKISIWASQQEFGSMMSVIGKTDADGNYRVLPKPGIRFGVSAYPPTGVPYMGRKAEKLVWENSDTTRKVDIQLPRVTLVEGLVIEKGTGKPVAGATITFESSERNAPKNVITGWQAEQKTNGDGKFTYPVHAGHGTLVVRKKDSNYVLQTMDSRKMTSNKPGGSRFYANAFHKMEVEKGTDKIEATIEVLPGKSVRGVIVDEDGNSIEEAYIVTRLKSWDHAGKWRGDSRPTVGGKFELMGLEPDESYKVHFLDARQKLGTTIELKATDEDVKVVLKPCGSMTAKFIVEDEKNRETMKSMQRPTLYFTLMPGVAKYAAQRLGKLAADEDFVGNIDRVNYGMDDVGPKLDDEFRITYPALIPGATYRLQTSFDQSFGYKEFTAKSGETLDLGEFTPKFNDF